MTEDRYQTETSDGALRLTVETDGSISKIEGGPLDHPVFTAPTAPSEVAPAYFEAEPGTPLGDLFDEALAPIEAEAEPQTPPAGGSIGSDGKVYYGVSK